MCPHWFHDVHAPLVAATPNARYVEYFWDDQVLNFRRLIDTQYEHKDGRLLMRQSPGLGFNFDESAVAKYSVSGGGFRRQPVAPACGVHRRERSHRAR